MTKTIITHIVIFFSEYRHPRQYLGVGGLGRGYSVDMPYF